ncbi:alpha/beta fold hydrolase [Deinococcus daejeonensis]|uniref:Hydrolase n=1 Tax=Deinococcus daejeonensis TaxID=1007098 RepID=A0ABQ2JLY5_9DEIO|nr:alpha/beta hydrolase [Deinococcus daejeonensis]GGN48160.1 hydrolase [Deinococcus daejeonensis]
MTPPQVTVQDGWLTHPQGELFTRCWQPALGGTTRAPFVLFHDSLGCVELWRDFPAALCAATGRAVIAYDRLGFGRSAAVTAPLPLTFIADEARTIMPLLQAHYGLKHFMAFGHSVGGGMAVECAAQWPEHCVGLVTEAAQAFVEDRTVQGIEAARVQFQAEAQVGRLAKYHGAKARWVVDAWTETWLSHGFADWSLARVVPQVACPWLIVHGALDEYGSRRHPELLQAGAGGPKRLAWLPGVGHVPHREVAAQVLAEVLDWSAGLAP